MWLWKHREQVGIAILAAIAMAFLAAALWLALADRAVAAATAGVLGLLLLTFVRLSRFKKVRGLGFEAELWEDKQLEAARLIAQTKEMLTLLGRTLVTAVPRMNRMMQAFSVPEQLALAAEVERMLRDYGAPASETTELYSEIDKWHAWDITAPICTKIRYALEADSQRRHRDVQAKFGSPITDIEGFNVESAEANLPLKHVFSSSDLMHTATRQWPDEVERRIAQMPLPEDKKAELSTRIESDLKRLRAWVTSRRYEEANT